MLTCVLTFSLAVSSLASNDVDSTNDVKNNTSHTDGQSPKKMISLSESLLKSQKQYQKLQSDAMKNYWNKTFADIEALEVYFPETAPFLNQWKIFLEENNRGANEYTSKKISLDAEEPDATTQTMKEKIQARVRFDGFRSWDRLLQEWKYDVTDYIEKKTIDSGGYPMSTFGKTAASSSDGALKIPEKDDTIPSSDEDLKMLERNEKKDGAARLTEIVELVSKSEPSLKEFPRPRPVQPGEELLPHTDISDMSKKIWIVTTAALPWMTGTAVNPLLRAAYLTEGRSDAGGKVTLMLPWLEQVGDQERVYGKDRVFENPEDQETYIRTWLRESANFEQASKDLNIAWYTGRQERAENSIYSMGDITALIPTEDVDICILEEPEHLNWYRAPGENWTTKFKHVVGIIHTNYFFYAQEQPAAFIRAPSMKLLCSWMCRCHCHRVIKLSGTLEKFAPEKELVENVHGVRGTFLDIGNEVRLILLGKERKSHPVFAPYAEPTVYFIGKMLWSKGLASLMELLEFAQESAGLKISCDMYGGGPNKEEAAAKSKKLGLNMDYHGPVDHSKLAFTHKIFINPSTSEVLCTTVAEALAMGKFVVVPSHPSNDFFAQFPNCLTYTNKEEFVGNLYYALTHSPEPLTAEYSYALSWRAATKRLEAAAAISVNESEEMAAAVESQEAGVEINLPPIINDDEKRKKLASTLSRSRERYRQFRLLLSDYVKQSKVLPKKVQKTFVEELDKRLDIDIEATLQSPTLRVKLSPAELDKNLLDFYNDVTGGAGGDVIRVIGGGAYVGRQHLYLKQLAQKRRREERKGRSYNPSHLLPVADEADKIDEKNRTPTQWVSLALRRNLPAESGKANIKPWGNSSKNKRDSATKMMMSMPQPRCAVQVRRWTLSPLI